MSRTSILAGTLIVSAALGSTALGPPAQQTVAPADPGWRVTGEVTPGAVLDRSALRFGTGEAYLPGVSLENGTVEFDVATSPLRTFFGLRLRADDRGAFEEIYLRPHKSGLPDALQYAPAFGGGRSSWQLYHGPGETAAVAYDHGRWMHVRVVVEGRRAAVFLDNAAEPQMVVPRLAREPRAGYIGFWSLDASPTRGQGHPTAMSNLVVRPGVVDVDWPSSPEPSPAPDGLVTSWQVSQAFAAPASGPVAELPAEVLSGPWTDVRTDPNGLLLLDAATEWPEGARRAAALARLSIDVEAARTTPFSFGFSDDASVFLNGRPIYSGVNGYSHNFPRRDGLITPDQATVYLSLQAGRNELVVAVADRFGGWGLMGRVTAADRTARGHQPSSGARGR